MSENYRVQMILAATIIVFTTFFLLSYNSVDLDFPFFKYGSNTINDRLIPSDPYDNISTLVSRFLWDNKSLELVSQAFVLLAAVMCSIALLKREEK